MKLHPFFIFCVKTIIILIFFINTSCAQDTITAATNTPNALSRPNDWIVGGILGLQPDNNPASMLFLTQAQDLNFDISIGNLGTVNLFGFNNQKFVVTAPNALEGIISDIINGMAVRVQAANNGVALPDGGIVLARADLEVQLNNSALEFTGNQLDGLGDIKLSSANSAVQFSADNSVINGSIDSPNGGSGIIVVNANNTQFNRPIGDSAPINWLRLWDNASAVLSENASFQAGGMDFGNNTQLSLSPNKEITFSNGAQINFNGSGTLILDGDHDRSIVSNITSNNNNGTIIYRGTAGKVLSLRGDIGNNGSSIGVIDLTAGGTLKISSDHNSDQYINTIDMGIKDGTVILNHAGLHVNNLVHGNNLGTVIISDEGVSNTEAATAGISGNMLGSLGNPIQKLQFQSTPRGALVNVLLITDSTNIYANSIETDTPGAGVLVFAQGTGSINAPIGTNVSPLLGVVLNNDTTVEIHGEAFLNQSLINAPYEIGLAPGTTVKIYQNLVGDVAGVDTVLSSTPILTPNGTLVFGNNAPITHTGNIITLNTVNLEGDNVTITENVQTQNLNFVSDSQLKLLGNNDKTINTSNINASNKGAIIANDILNGKKLTITGYVGDPNNKLTRIEAKGGGSIEFKSQQGDTSPRSVHVQTIDISGNDGTVEFNGGEHSGFNLIHDNHTGTIVINATYPGSFTQFNNGIFLGDQNHYLKKMIFKDNGSNSLFNVLAFPDSVDLYVDSIQTDAAAQGVLLFGGTSHVIDAEVGTIANPLRVIAVGLNNNYTTLELRKDAYLAGGLGFYGDSLIKVKGNITTSNDILFGGGAFGIDYADLTGVIKGTKGTLEFINDNAATFDGQIDHLNLVKISGRDVTITKSVDMNELNFSNPAIASTLTLNDSATLNSATTRGNGIHNITFKDNTNVNGNIGSLSNKFGNITLANDFSKPLLLNANIYSSTITADSAHIKANDNIEIHGNIQGVNTRVNFSDNELVYKGNTNLSGEVRFYTAFTTSQNGNHKGGHITLSDNSRIDFSGATDAKIILTANSSIPPTNNPYSYVLFEKGDGEVYPALTTFESQEANRYVTWSYNPETFILSGVRSTTIVQDVTGNDGNANNIAIAEGLSDPNVTGDAASIQNALGLMDPASVNNVINGLTPVALSEATTAEASDLVEKSTQERISSHLIATELLSMENNTGAGVASGDNNVHRYGVWISPFYSKAIQKSFLLEAGYKAKSYGSTVGVDNLINKNLTIGAAVSAIRTIVHHNSAGLTDTDDKGDAKAILLSLYGLKNLTSELFIQGIGFVGFSKLHNMEQRVINSSTMLYAHSNYNSTSYGSKLLLGKKLLISKRNTVLVPMAGMRYNYSKDSSYKTRGAGIQNLTVSSKSSSSLEGILGLRASTAHIVNDFTIKPELQAFINYRMKEKPLSMDINIDGMVTPVRISCNKARKAWYTFGGGMSFAKNEMENGIYYETELDKKYINHQIALKLRLKF